MRRNRLVIGAGVATSVAIVAAWFPASDLLHQRSQLDAASAALAQLGHENQVLHHEARQLQTKSAIAHIAQQQYGLVTSGVQAYQVLPAGGDGDGSLATTSSTAAARAASDDGTGVGGQTASRAHGAARTPTSGGFFTRVAHTLEFWR